LIGEAEALRGRRLGDSRGKGDSRGEGVSRDFARTIRECEMRKLMTGLALAICAAGFAAPPILGTGAALAQSEPSGLRQVPLTEVQIKQYLAARKDIEAVLGDAPPQAADKPDPKIAAKVEAIAKKYQFASYGEFDRVAGNIAIILEGVDPKTKKYVGSDVMLRQEIAAVQADKWMSPADKKAALADLNGDLKAIVPIQNKANIDLVLKHYDELAAEEPQQK
jgi:hypothetical protein